MQKHQIQGKAVLTLLAILFIASSCIGSQDMALGLRDSGRHIELRKGQILAVSLESNPSTGYSWHVAEGTGSVIDQPEDKDFTTADNVNPPRPGAGGIETFRFRALSKGRSSLRLIYQRPWEKKWEPLKTFTLTLEVR